MRLIEPDWPRHPRVQAVSTTRIGGFSEGAYTGMNLGTHVGDDPIRVAQNRDFLRTQLSLPAEPMWLEQIHGVEVAYLPEAGQLAVADAAWTDQPEVVCVVMSADCLPVLLADRFGRCVAAVHAGWRGLAAGVLEAALKALPVSPFELTAWLGPAISARAYEVDETVREAFITRSKEFSAAFAQTKQGHYALDLSAAARIVLRKAGVAGIFGGNRCTLSEPELFYSHRREGRSGRMANLIWLK